MNTLATRLQDYISRLEGEKAIYEASYKRLSLAVGFKDAETIWMKARMDLSEDVLFFLNRIVKGDE